MNRIKRIWIKLRLAMLGIDAQESTTAIAWHEERLEHIAQKEIDLRIALHRVNPIRAKIVYPEMTK